MIELAKGVVVSVIDLLTIEGFFYEYGVVRSLLAIAGYALVSLLLARKINIKALDKMNVFPSLLVGVFGVCFVYIYFRSFSISDYGYFYPPTINKRFESIEAMSLLYGVTMVAYYNFYKIALDGSKKVILYLCMLALITSPLQLWVLFSSSTRDFTKAFILTILFILIIKIIRQKINFTNRNIYYCSAIMVVSMIFRQDILLYFPILMLAVMMYYGEALKVRFCVIVKIIAFFLPGYLFLTLGVFNTIERASGRIIPGLSEDLVRMYYGEPSSYIGPFNDLNGFIVTETSKYTHSFTSPLHYVFNNIDFIAEYCLRVPGIMLDTYVLPLTSSIYPEFFAKSTIGNALGDLRSMLSYEYIYIAAIIFVIYDNRSNKKLLVFMLAVALYISVFNGFQFLHKNIFHLEIISYLILFYGCVSIARLLKEAVGGRFITQR
jgi:hypothetical protein